ncbi:MAG: SusC/RagA family TonB-linked outer membrane protein [Gloeobacteraceae cyanobacterium ES-bin-316]|nr:SusC/RagA family TonB-linked outer membrane protein [Ferruginibacter sp.]
MRKKLLLFLCASMCMLFSFGQSRLLKGKVTDDKNFPMENVSVGGPGIKKGTMSLADGSFSISLPVSQKTIVLSFSGFQKQEISIEGKNEIVVVMNPAIENLSDVVVVGYSTINKATLSGSVAKVSGEELANKPVLSLDQALAGKAAGVQVNTSSGLVGDVVNIRIRGAASISSGSQPLIVMDGVPLIQGNQGQLYNPANALADINPNDIESVEVLKDASAASIYGSRASGGVLLITTKKGRSGQPSVSYDSYFGLVEASRKIGVLNAEQYTSVINQMRANAGLANIAALGDYDKDGKTDNTNWQKELYRKGGTQNHQLSFSGGVGKTNYYASLNYNDFKNYMIINRQQRASARLNITSKVKDWLEFGVKTQFSRTTLFGLGSGTGGALSGVPFGPLTAYPNVPVYDSTGAYYNNAGGNSPLNNTPNPVAVQNLNYDTRDNRRFIGSAYGEASLLKGLKLKSQYNIDYQTALTDQFWDPFVGDGAGSGGVGQTVTSEVRTWSWFNTLNYNTRIRSHDIGALLGVEYTRNLAISNYAYGATINDPLFKLITSSNYATVGVTNAMGLPNNGIASYFGALNYGFQGKYFATLNMRTDAYSGFGRSNRWGTFPSASAAWKISDERFWRLKSVNDLKLRASYGITGNSNIGDYPSLSTFLPSQYADIPTLILNSPGNVRLRWEQTAQTNIGFDGLLFGKLNITADYYLKQTKDLILSNPVLATVGFPGNTITQNIGALKATGVELSLGIPVTFKNSFTYNVSLNVAWNKNEVVSTNDNRDDIFGGFSIVRPGKNMSAFYLIRWGGVNAQNGLPTFYDINGILKQYNHALPVADRWTNVSDGTVTTAITAADRIVHNNKTPYPTFFGGVNQVFTFKGFDLVIDAQYSFGAYTYNLTKATLMSNTSNRNKSADILDAWQTPGQVTDVPKLFWGDNQASQASTRWLEKADFVRIRNIQAGFAVPEKLLKKSAFKKIRIYGQVQNAFLITGYSGIDPEANSNGNTNIGLGVDNFRPYLPRTVTIGFNAGF